MILIRKGLFLRRLLPIGGGPSFAAHARYATNIWDEMDAQPGNYRDNDNDPWQRGQDAFDNPRSQFQPMRNARMDGGRRFDNYENFNQGNFNNFNRGRDNYNNDFDRGRGYNVSGFGGRPRQFGDRFGMAGANLRPINWAREKLTPVKKNLYQECEAVSRRSNEELGQWLSDNDCTLHGKNIPRPVFEFEESGFPQPIVDILNQNYKKPAAVQSITWPVALSGFDLVSVAQTGTGKTLAFILPAIVHTLAQPQRLRGEGPSVLILTPTRELANQVREMSEEYCKAVNLSLGCCYGGVPRTNQAAKFHSGIDICVATPGRMQDFLESGTTNLKRCTYLVLDEADRMLDMGFEPQIRRIISQARPDRQTLMFSATWPKDVRNLAADFQNEPIQLYAGSLDLSANPNIKQHVEIVDEFSKKERLQQLLSQIMQEPANKTLIFVQTKRLADILTQTLRREGISALCIHGDKAQTERDWVIAEFKKGKSSILLATDIAARGLDVSDIKYVINYDFPNTVEDYVHRIGRTGRQDKKGTSYTFLTMKDEHRAKELIEVMEKAKQEVPEELRNMRYGGRRM